MARGHNCHRWKYIHWTESPRGIVVLHYECQHCGAWRASNHAQRPRGCLYRQERIEWELDHFAIQLRALNKRPPPGESPGGMVPA